MWKRKVAVPPLTGPVTWKFRVSASSLQRKEVKSNDFERYFAALEQHDDIKSTNQAVLLCYVRRFMWEGEVLRWLKWFLMGACIYQSASEVMAQSLRWSPGKGTGGHTELHGINSQVIINSGRKKQRVRINNPSALRSRGTKDTTSGLGHIHIQNRSAAPAAGAGNLWYSMSTAPADTSWLSSASWTRTLFSLVCVSHPFKGSCRGKKRLSHDQ